MSDDLEILHHGDVQLLDWGESRATGPWIKLRLQSPEALDVFRGMDTAGAKKTGHIMSCTLATGDIAQLAAEEPKKGAHGKFWQQLIASGIFRSLPVLYDIGTEEQFEHWIRGQVSAIDGNHDWDEQHGEPVCDPAHVRRTSEGSGTAQKPPYFAVPLTHDQHLTQHNHGEDALERYFDEPPEDMGAWLEKKADHYRAEWGSRRLAETLAPGCNSRSEVHPDLVRCWLEERDLLIYLPKGLR